MRYFVTSVPERAHVVAKLKTEIPRLVVVEDKIRNYKHTHIQMIKAAVGDSALCLEDDVELTTDFIAKTNYAISERPHDVIQFFSRRGKDASEGSRYEQYFSFCCCYYLPKDVVENYLSFVPLYMSRDNKYSRSKSGCDRMLNIFFRENKIQHWIHVPSLVQHLEMKSTLGARSTKRQSGTFKP